MKIAKHLASRARKELWSTRPDETLPSFATILRDRSVGALTVLDEDGILIGIVSERDLVRACAEHGSAMMELTVGEVMTSEVVTCSLEDDMLETLEMMNACHIRHIPVMKEGRPLTMIGIREFDAACRELKELASTDPLTGIPNRHQFMLTLNKEIERHRRINAPLSVAMLNLNWTNENTGDIEEGASNDLLVWLAEILTKEFRTYDGLGRVGDEKFAVMFPNSAIHEAEAACERLGRAVRREEATTRYGDFPVTISQGLTSIHRYRVSGEEFLGVADSLLSEAQTAGCIGVVARSYLTINDEGVSFAV